MNIEKGFFWGVLMKVYTKNTFLHKWRVLLKREDAMFLDDKIKMVKLWLQEF